MPRRKRTEEETTEEVTRPPHIKFVNYKTGAEYEVPTADLENVTPHYVETFKTSKSPRLGCKVHMEDGKEIVVDETVEEIKAKIREAGGRLVDRKDT